MEIIYLQLTFLICLSTIPSFFISLPVLLLRWRLKKDGNSIVGDPSSSKLSPKMLLIISLTNSFACGVFLAVCFLSLIPASDSKWNSLWAIDKMDHDPSIDHHMSQVSSFPISKLVILIGFSIMFIVDKLFTGTRDQNSIPAISVTTATTPDENISFSDLLPLTVNHNREARTNTDPFSIVQNEDDQSQQLPETEELGVQPESCSVFAKHYVSLQEIQSGFNSKMDSPQSQSSDYGSIEPNNIFSRARLNGRINFCKSNPFHEIVSSMGGLNLILFLATMGWHNFFEGLSLGIQTDIDMAISLFVGILVHGILLAIAISLTALKTWQPPIKMSFARSIVYLVLVVLFRPVGLLLGLSIGSSEGFGATLLVAILQSISAGIFFHITFFSLIPGEFSKPRIDDNNKCHTMAMNDGGQVKLHWKLVSLVLGWISLASLMLLVKHSH